MKGLGIVLVAAAAGLVASSNLCSAQSQTSVRTVMYGTIEPAVCVASVPDDCQYFKVYSDRKGSIVVEPVNIDNKYDVRVFSLAGDIVAGSDNARGEIDMSVPDSGVFLVFLEWKKGKETHKVELK